LVEVSDSKRTAALMKNAGLKGARQIARETVASTVNVNIPSEAPLVTLNVMLHEGAMFTEEAASREAARRRAELYVRDGYWAGSTLYAPNTIKAVVVIGFSDEDTR
jgi:hypothetical protein